MGLDQRADLRRKDWRKCIGNGQYYDPSSGRFLSRQSGQGGNPYLPKGLDPIGAMVGPLALVGMLAGKSKKKKLGLVIMVLMIVLASGVALAGCGSNPPSAPRWPAGQSSRPGARRHYLQQSTNPALNNAY
ncbi:MAG: hypothetical protein P4L50_11170 [Anaerolineaceae bacterium]|nr:hypothetical protein [Anaerolineaceae bacterium]